MTQLTLVTGRRMSGRFKGSGAGPIVATAAETCRRGLIVSEWQH